MEYKKRKIKNRIKTSAVLLLFSLIPATAVLADPENGVQDGTQNEVQEGTTEGSTISSSDSIFYTGPIDLVTGQPITGESEESSGQLVQIGNGVSYDRYSRRYIYPVGNSRILCSVVSVNLDIALYVNIKTESAVNAESGEHMVKKAYPRTYI